MTPPIKENPWQRFIAGVNDTPDKFVRGVVDTAEQFIAGVGGTLIHKKKFKSKISCQTPFNYPAISLVSHPSPYIATHLPS